MRGAGCVDLTGLVGDDRKDAREKAEIGCLEIGEADGESVDGLFVCVENV